jgi:hypothetical protein
LAIRAIGEEKLPMALISSWQQQKK